LFLDAEVGAPGVFSDQQQGVHPELDMDLVASHLIEAAAGMLGAGGGEALG
jgi:hypothetical protein